MITNIAKLIHNGLLHSPLYFQTATADHLNDQSNLVELTHG
jgi:hypothetical protein